MSLCVDYGFQDRSSGVTESSMVGIIVSRGSAAGISFLFPYMLLTVCRNLITMCRETFLNSYIPFDSAIDLHRLMAMTAIILSGKTSWQNFGAGYRDGLHFNSTLVIWDNLAYFLPV